MYSTSTLNQYHKVRQKATHLQNILYISTISHIIHITGHGTLSLLRRTTEKHMHTHVCVHTRMHAHTYRNTLRTSLCNFMPFYRCIPQYIVTLYYKITIYRTIRLQQNRYMNTKHSRLLMDLNVCVYFPLVQWVRWKQVHRKLMTITFVDNQVIVYIDRNISGQSFNKEYIQRLQSISRRDFVAKRQALPPRYVAPARGQRTNPHFYPRN